MERNQQKSSHIVLPSCRVLIEEVDCMEFKAAQLAPSRLRIKRPPIVPLRLRPEGCPPYLRSGDDDTHSVLDLDSYHADDESSDSEDTSSCGLIDDESDSSERSSDDSLRTPQSLSSGVFAKKRPSIAERRQLPAPRIRVSTRPTQPTYFEQHFIPQFQRFMEWSPNEAYSSLSTRLSDYDVPLLYSPILAPTSHLPAVGRLDVTSGDAPRSPDFTDELPASPNSPTSPLEPDKGGPKNGECAALPQGTSAQAKAAVHNCTAENCLKTSYLNALFEHSGRLPSRAPTSLTPALPSAETGSFEHSKQSPAHAVHDRNSAHSPSTSRASSGDLNRGATSPTRSDRTSIRHSSSVNPSRDSPTSIKSPCASPSLEVDDPNKEKPRRRAHAPLHLVDPAVTFSVPDSDGVTKTFGIAVSDILEYAGVYMLRANDSMWPLWENVAPGAMINLTIHWKGHAEAKVYPIVVKCDCGFIIRRSQLALALARAQLSYFATSQLDPSYAPPADSSDPFHPCNFIIKDHHNLHLMSLFTPDNGATWRTNHAIVEDPSTLTPDPEPERTPSGQLVIPNARVLLAVRRLRAKQEMRAQEALRLQQLKAERRLQAFEKWRAKQEAKAQKKLAAKEEAQARKQAKMDAKIP
ncbi:hypothetical protein LshimejAT787_1800890 [Lyophyllum shimeji]|uniref:Uncharacterized protein n=1 Tax=Lyophyllum shimeji TaxID=47721 RepID=A0A9P3PXC3_LYOSH|nr:hypothetical protein LshimejAT787_1800890 [Lyophyllum shimeji]